MFTGWNPLDFNPWAACGTVVMLVVILGVVLLARYLRRQRRDARAWRESQENADTPSMIIIPPTWDGMPPENTDRVRNWRKRVSDLDELPYDPHEPL
jgi:hypothetical protein